MTLGRRPRARPARIVDVAARAGVSRQTVSNVINGRDGFTEETRAKVEAAITELGFRVNTQAQSLRSKRTMLLGFDLSEQQLDVTNPFTLTFLRALVRSANARQYRVVVFALERGNPGHLKETINARVVDGFIFNDAPADDARARVAANAGLPFVVLGRTADDLPQTWVDIDNRVAVHDVVDHLAGRGYRRYAYVGYPLDVYWNRDRLAATRERLKTHGLSLPADVTLLGQPDEVRPAIVRLLTRPDIPEAIVTSSDTMAMLVVNIAHSLNLRVGRDVAVSGFDAGPLTTMVELTLTSVQIPVDVIADTLIDRLVAELRGPTGEPGQLIRTRSILGQST